MNGFKTQLLIFFVGMLLISTCYLFEDQSEDAEARDLALLGLALPGAGASSGDDGGSGSTCFNCHFESTATGVKILAAKAQYEQSGHKNGPRGWIVLKTSGGLDIAETLFHGSNAAYTNNASCAKCHTHQGFLRHVAGEPAQTVPYTSQVGCFTCHAPHESGNFELRTSTSVTLVDSTTIFDHGKGNLCAQCHLSRSASKEYTVDTNWSSYSGAHHGPQADIIKGVNNYAYVGKSYATSNVHATTNSCVTCHTSVPDGTTVTRTHNSLEVAGHGMYVTALFHGSMKPYSSTCKQCHDEDIGNDKAFNTLTRTAGADWDGDGGPSETKIAEVEGLYDRLLVYFSGNLCVQGHSPLDTLTGNVVGTGGVWRMDWDFSGTKCTLTAVRSKAFWNFKILTEDHSGGVHNPMFSAQMLHDAITDLNANAAAGITVGATRPAP